MNKEKLVIKEDVEEKFIGIVITFAKEEGLTLNNVKEAIEKVSTYMAQNATLKE